LKTGVAAICGCCHSPLMKKGQGARFIGGRLQAPTSKLQGSSKHPGVR
jgi:hypothetical protein